MDCKANKLLAVARDHAERGKTIEALANYQKANEIYAAISELSMLSDYVDHAKRIRMVIKNRIVN